MTTNNPLPADPRTPQSLALRQSLGLQPLARPDVAAEPEDDALNIQDLLRIVWKHKWMVLALTLLLGMAAVIQSLRGTPMYQASTMLQIERTAQRVVAFGEDVDANRDYWDDGTMLQTQIELLKSRALAERVVDAMGLDQRRGAGQAQTTFGRGQDSASEKTAGDGANGFIDRLLATWRTLNTPAVTNADALGRDGTVGAFMGSVSIEPIRNSRLVNVVVVNSNAELAARIANTVAENFISMNLERRMESSLYARGFLEDQIRVTKAKLEDSERLINEYTKRNAILVLDERTNVTSQNFSELAAALARVEQERIKAEALYNEVQRRPESAPQVIDSKAVQTYKEQKARLEAEYTTNLTIYKPDFPKMVQLRAQIQDVDARIQGEMGAVVGSVRAQYEAAKRQEEQLRQLLDQSRQQVQTVQDRSVDLNLLKRELETNRQVYDALLQRLKEVSVTGGLTTNSISVVDEARTPLYPYSPQPMRHGLIGLALGLLLGLGLAFLRETLDDSVRHSDEVESTFGLPLLGWIPLVRTRKGAKGSSDSPAMLAHSEPRSAFAEAYRSMRTALQFSTTQGSPRRLMVTSCGKGEGKTTTALSLAITFAQLGKKVLLVDADMRNPSVHRALAMPNDQGLSNFLSGHTEGSTLTRDTTIDGLSVVTAGPLPPDPVELLAGPKFALLLDKAHEMGFEHIIVDGPPMLGIADALVLGNQIQHIVFVVKAASTRRTSVKDSLRRMRMAGLAPMGVVLTHAKDEHTPDYAYENYYGYEGRSGADAGPVSVRGSLEEAPRPS